MLTPGGLWAAWNLAPLPLFGLFLGALAYARGRPRDRRRAWCFAGALAALAVALVSPLDALAGALASAHMVQHVLLTLVAAPLLALSAPGSALLRGSPPAVRRAAGRWGRRTGARAALRVLRHPAAAWLLPVATLWFWHASVPYDAALAGDALHVVEHVTFLLTSLLFWQVVLGARERVSPGLGLLLVFTNAVQSVFLSVLLTFARTPWYEGYATSTVVWGLDQLADQQLAGAIMWIPAGMVYLAAGLALLVDWVRTAERAGADEGAAPARQPA